MFYLFSYFKSEIVDIQLLSEKRLQVKLIKRHEFFIIEVEGIIETLCFFNYLTFCWKLFQQNEACLTKTITRNPQVMMSPEMLIHFEQTTSMVFKSANQDAKLIKSMRMIIEATNEILLDFFSRPYESTANIKVVVDRLNNMLFDTIRKKFDNNYDVFELREMTELIGMHCSNFEKFNIFDLRVSISTKFFLNIYKKLFFARICRRIELILNTIDRYDQNSDEKGNYAPIIYQDFFKIIREAMFDMKPLISIPDFDLIVFDLKRKFFYFFFNNLLIIIEKKLVNLPYNFLIVLLSGLEFCQIESSSFFECSNEKYQSISYYFETLNSFRTIYDKIEAAILHQISTFYFSEISSKIEQIQPKLFRLASFLNIELKVKYLPILKLKNDQKLIVLKELFKKIIEGYICFVRIQDEGFIKSALFIDHVNQFKQFFAETGKKEEFESFSMFFEIFSLFLSSNNKMKCENYIGMLKTILGSDLPNQLIFKIIETKNYSGLRFNANTILTSFNVNMDEFKKGSEGMLKRQKLRKVFAKNIFLAMRVFRFIKILTKRIFKMKSLSDQVKPPRNLAEVELVLNEKSCFPFSKNCQILFFKREELFQFSKPRISDFIKEVSQNSVKSEFILKFENRHFLVFDIKSNLIRILRPALISSVEKYNSSSYKALLILYKEAEFIIIFTQKPEIQTFLYNNLIEVSSIFRSLTFNKNRLFY